MYIKDKITFKSKLKDAELILVTVTINGFDYRIKVNKKEFKDVIENMSNSFLNSNIYYDQSTKILYIG